MQSLGMQVNNCSTSRDKSLPLLVQPLAKFAKDSVLPRCLSETSPRFLVRHLPKKEARLDVGEFVLEIIGLTGIESSVMLLLWVLRLHLPRGKRGYAGRKRP